MTVLVAQSSSTGENAEDLAGGKDKMGGRDEAYVSLAVGRLTVWRILIHLHNHLLSFLNYKSQASQTKYTRTLQ